ncbi:protein CDV3 homolog [Hydractinia symbiolongicarpus]|uniref:protein CDV3 homolog n=1 Tax=Hydractinia symbiolongicarpus TaxID=13093 RepID=UPI00254C020D|nr:protein CDV3 homolog [Hydractinia symbiolongicarpus]
MSDEEEHSLDSFFAKKDKSKKPKKKKKVKSSETTETQSETQIRKSQVDDWADFEEEKEKDYSSLKIQDLQIMEENAKEELEEVNCDDDDEDTEKKTAEQTIWNVQTTAPSTHHTEPVEQITTPNVVSGKYVPPSLKRSNMMGQPVKRRPGVPPDIKSQSAFPTLGAANEDLGTGKTPSDFEVVKRGVRSNDARLDDTKPNLDLGNRYDGLRS